MCEGPEPDPGKLFGEVHVLKICRWTLKKKKKVIEVIGHVHCITTGATGLLLWYCCASSSAIRVLV